MRDFCDSNMCWGRLLSEEKEESPFLPFSLPFRHLCLGQGPQDSWRRWSQVAASSSARSDQCWFPETCSWNAALLSWVDLGQISTSQGLSFLICKMGMEERERTFQHKHFHLLILKDLAEQSSRHACRAEGIFAF